MTILSGQIIEALCMEFGPEEVLRRLSDPYWFQCLGSVVGFDWHSSGLTTTLTGAIKEALKDRSFELGLFVAGGKGRISRKTPNEILTICDSVGIDADPLVQTSRLVAKVDQAAVQDGYNLYHHFFVFTQSGRWAVVQQGMCEEDSTARRYHWLSEGLESFVVEPHSGVSGDRASQGLNLVHRDSLSAQNVITELASRPPEKNIKDLKRLFERQVDLFMPQRHFIIPRQDIRPEKLRAIFEKTYERQASDFQSLLGTEGVGGRTLRALSLISELIYGTPASYKDPARFSYALGGKDRVPYPVDLKNYERVIEVMEGAIKKARLGQSDRIRALRVLYKRFTLPSKKRDMPSGAAPSEEPV
jgi:hypothetical protein